MQNQNSTNRNNVTKQLSPTGYCVAGIIGLLLLILFGRILLILAIIGGVGWLIWKFRWAIQYYWGQINSKIDAQAQAYQQKYQKTQQAQRLSSSQYSNPFRTSRQYQPNQTGWSSGAATQGKQRNAIFDVTPEKENN